MLVQSRRCTRLFAAIVGVMATTTAASAEKITLDEALSLADTQHPDIGVAEANLEEAEGERKGADKRLYNPELGIAAGPALGRGDLFFPDLELSIFQTFELGDKRRKRAAAAGARKAAATASVTWARTLVAVRVRRTYFLAIVARERVETAGEAETVAAELKTAADERLRLGAGTKLEVNVYTSVLGKAKSERIQAERAYLTAQAELASAVGAPAATLLEPSGDLPAFEPLATGEDELVASALGRRGDLLAQKARRDAAAGDVAIADAGATPDITFGLTYAYEQDPDVTRQVVLVGFSMPLPFFNKNQGQRASSRAALRRARTEEDSGRREAEREVRAAYRSYRLALDAVAGFDRDVIESLGENLTLAQESFRTGKIGIVEFNTIRRELVDTRLAYLDALVGLIEARFALELAAGGEVK